MNIKVIDKETLFDHLDKERDDVYDTDKLIN